MAEGFLQMKLLGALQVVLGVADLGFGGVAASIPESGFAYWSTTITSGFPFWGGILFMLSGSLLLAAEHYPKPLLVRSSLRAHVCSTVASGVGTILLIADLSVSMTNGHVTPAFLAASNGLWGLLLFTGLLELAIAAPLCYQGYQAARRPPQPAAFPTPYAVNGTPMDLPVSLSAPPAYGNAGFAP